MNRGSRSSSKGKIARRLNKNIQHLSKNHFLKLKPTDGFESAPPEKLTAWREECCEKALQMKTMDQSVICYCYADADKIVLSGHRVRAK